MFKSPHLLRFLGKVLGRGFAILESKRCDFFFRSPKVVFFLYVIIFCQSLNPVDDSEEPLSARTSRFEM